MYTGEDGHFKHRHTDYQVNNYSVYNCNNKKKTMFIRVYPLYERFVFFIKQPEGRDFGLNTVNVIIKKGLSQKQKV